MRGDKIVKYRDDRNSSIEVHVSMPPDSALEEWMTEPDIVIYLKANVFDEGVLVTHTTFGILSDPDREVINQRISYAVGRLVDRVDV